MAARRFCDICDALLTEEDNKPFIRCHKEKDVKVSMIVTNSQGSVESDICNNCKQTIIIDGITLEERLKNPIIVDSSVSRVPSLNNRQPGKGSATGSQPADQLPIVYEPPLKKESKEIRSQPLPEGEPG